MAGCSCNSEILAMPDARCAFGRKQLGRALCDARGGSFSMSPSSSVYTHPKISRCSGVGHYLQNTKKRRITIADDCGASWRFLYPYWIPPCILLCFSSHNHDDTDWWTSENKE